MKSYICCLALLVLLFVTLTCTATPPKPGLNQSFRQNPEAGRLIADTAKKQVAYNYPSEQLELKHSVYVFIVEGSVGLPVASAKAKNNALGISAGIKIVNGVRLSEYASVGLGLGLDNYEGMNLAPITFDLRVALSQEKISPMLNIAAGYAIFLEDTQIGFIINPSAGIKLDLPNNAALLLSLGFKLQEMRKPDTQYQLHNDTANSTYGYLKFLTASLGFAF